MISSWSGHSASLAGQNEYIGMATHLISLKGHLGGQPINLLCSNQQTNNLVNYWVPICLLILNYQILNNIDQRQKAHLVFGKNEHNISPCK